MKTISQMLGLRSQCCNAKLSAWDTHTFYCQECNIRTDQLPASILPAQRKVVLQHVRISHR